MNLSVRERELILDTLEEFLESSGIFFEKKMSSDVKEFNDQAALVAIQKVLTKNSLVSAEDLRIIVVSLLARRNKLTDCRKSPLASKAYLSEIKDELELVDNLYNRFNYHLETAGLATKWDYMMPE